MQFNQIKDFEFYPRSLDEDIKMAEKAGVDALFIPNEQEIYPDQCPSIDTPDREIWRYLGQVELVRMLESVYTEQNNLN